MPPVLRQRAGSTRKKRSKTRSTLVFGMPTPWSVTAISTTPSVDLDPDADAARRRASTAIAFAIRLCTATTSSGWSPKTSARHRRRTATRDALRRRRRPGSGRPPRRPPRRCRRSTSALQRRRAPAAGESSMISLVMSREPLGLDREATRRTASPASGSSAAWSSASASRLTAPIGVFSSWLMLATKSRRTSSSRCASVRSSASSSTKRVPSRATRTSRRSVRLAERPAREGELVGDRLAVAAHRCDELEQLGVHERLVPHESDGERARATPAGRCSTGRARFRADSRTSITSSTPSGIVGATTFAALAPRRSAMCSTIMTAAPRKRPKASATSTEPGRSPWLKTNAAGSGRPAEFADRAAVR